LKKPEKRKSDNTQEPDKTLTSTKLPHRISPSRILSWTMLGLGAIALVSSIVYVSSILALVGLGLIFWGAILSFIQTEEYVKKTLLDATSHPAIDTLNTIINELDYRGKAVYLPTKYFKNPEASKIYIAKKPDTPLPNPEQIQQQENKFFITDPLGLLFTPLGAELAELFEKALDTKFAKVDLKYLQRKLPKLLIEDLEICQSFEIRTQGKNIHIKIQNSVFKDQASKAEETQTEDGQLGCTLCSAIACALAKTTGKLVTIGKTKTSEDGKTTEADFQLLETAQVT